MRRLFPLLALLHVARANATCASDGVSHNGYCYYEQPAAETCTDTCGNLSLEPDVAGYEQLVCYQRSCTPASQSTTSAEANAEWVRASSNCFAVGELLGLVDAADEIDAMWTNSKGDTGCIVYSDTLRLTNTGHVDQGQDAVSDLSQYGLRRICSCHDPSAPVID